MLLCQRLGRQWAAVLILSACAVASSCSDTKQSGKLEVRLESQQLVWLHEAKTEKLTPGSGEQIRMSGVLYNGARGPVHGLTVSKKSCGCFQVEIAAQELQHGETATCTVFVPAGPAFPNAIEFTIAGKLKSGNREESIEAVSKLKAYLIPHWHTQVPNIVFHSTDGVISSETIVISRYAKSLQDVGNPHLQIENGPDWLSISEVNQIGQRKLLDGVVATEYRVRFAPDIAAPPGKDRSTELENGRIKLRCGDGVATALDVQYRVVRHGPYFHPSTVLFDETAIGKTTDRIVTLMGVGTEQLRFKCTPECLSAELKIPGGNEDAGNRPPDGAIPIQISFAPTVGGSIKGEIVVERAIDGKAVAVLNVRGKAIHAAK